MIFRRSNSRWVRTLRVALCYVVAMQAFLAAFGTTMAAARATAFDPLQVICHSGDSEQAVETATAEILKSFRASSARPRRPRWGWNPARRRSPQSIS